jgi:divalent metal cation (Fe/Co/Zn/Cd) transporter
MHDLPFMTYCVNNGYRRDKRTTYDAPSCNPTNRVMMIPDRAALVRRGMLLNYATLGYNALEAVIAVVAGVLAGSIALVGFGLDSVVEVIASVAAQWRLRADLDELRRVRTEWIARRIIGWSFLALAAYVSYESIMTLWERRVPERSILGLAILVLSVIVMPWLARRKRQVARALSSRALEAEAKQTSLCAYLSVIALAGVGLNTFFGWWWADPVAALGMVPIIATEGVEGVRVARLS